MLQYLRRKKGQGVIGEYAMIIAVVSIAIMAMTVYVRRTLQARYRDASVMVVTKAVQALPSAGNVLLEYEPYYTKSTTNTVSNTTVTDSSNSTLMDKYTNTERRVSTVSEQLPF